MLKLNGFIAAIQQAIETASDAVAKENVKILTSYFDEVPMRQSPEENPKNNVKIEPFLNFDPKSNKTQLIPKMVAMTYPRETAKGIVEHQVMVPLISLAPITTLQPTEMTVEIDLEFLERDDDIIVGFPQLKKSMFGGEKTQDNKPNAKLTMKITTTNRPAGISAVIEGYDKVVRAQIPS
ncbi:DUF2589 domain-containing protein [Rheinheimera baltica]|uniref:DUF2589 domain-containing protein n=1 Tax=Rheinheimera baltica TaxID=67576 RepID=A0ABT9HZ97_9GAMM|nr:DUF2589 domain-containing protein [Rheinheimera baltica]MDP5136442.1 DUF2589 domain-containing protein [Rheinheimera baltica]MDP5143860.1 DUF2589 domain-containing protein [Rheinheimera baltica]